MAQATLETNKNYVIKLQEEIQTAMYYIRIGNGMYNKKSGITSIDMIDVFKQMTKTEMNSFDIVVKNIPLLFDPDTKRYYTLGISTIKPDIFTSDSNRRMFQRGIKLLKEKDLIRKRGRYDYMINPYAVVPSKEYEAIEIWDGLVAGSG